LGKLYTEPRCSGGFLVENKERAQADVKDFLFNETDLWARCSIP
jgi:hypothetical protein